MGPAGVRVSVIGMGTNQFGRTVDQNAANDIIDAAIDLGINFIDTADVYAAGDSETLLGIALQGKWDKFVVATKGYNAMGDGTNDKGNSRYHLINAVEASLRRLQSDHIDLYQLHRWDVNTPIAETMRTLDDLVSSGKIRYIGGSAFAAWQLAQANLLADMRGWERFVTMQSHYHMLEREVEKEVIPFGVADGVGFIPYFPLAGGFLTGKYKRGEDAPAGSRGENSPYVQKYMTGSNYDKVEQLTAWAEARDHTMAELAHVWLLAQPTVCSVISGMSKMSQLEANAKAADWSLNADEVAEINMILDA
jgi:aryl-alcohol dehydrogenase-like predicted oxidoreductase